MRRTLVALLFTLGLSACGGVVAEEVKEEAAPGEVVQQGRQGQCEVGEGGGTLTGRCQDINRCFTPAWREEECPPGELAGRAFYICGVGVAHWACTP